MLTYSKVMAMNLHFINKLGKQICYYNHHIISLWTYSNKHTYSCSCLQKQATTVGFIDQFISCLGKCPVKICQSSKTLAKSTHHLKIIEMRNKHDNDLVVRLVLKEHSFVPPEHPSFSILIYLYHIGIQWKGQIHKFFQFCALNPTSI